MKLKPIYIEWCDATSNENAWRTVDEAIEWANNENWVVKNMGWLIKKTKEYVLITTKMSDENDWSEMQVGSIFKIPTTWIRKLQYMKHDQKRSR